MYMLMYYLPSTMFVMASWISFFIPPTSYPARVSLLITTLLVLVNIFNNVVLTTPKDAHGITAIVLWLIGCILFVFAALTSYVFVIIKMKMFENQTQPMGELEMEFGNKTESKEKNITDFVLFCILSWGFALYILVYYFTIINKCEI